MATKKKAKKRQPKPKGAKKPAKKHSTVKRASSQKKSAKKRAVGKTKSKGRKSQGPRTASASKPARSNNQTVRTVTSPRESGGALSGRQSGDMQGLSNTESADSQSVDELLEEGNTFEADVVKGVEEAGSADEAEVRTREVPEDDVPDEYLDKDQ